METKPIPKVIKWNRAFCWAMVALNLAIFIGIVTSLGQMDTLMKLLAGDIGKELPEYELAKNTLSHTFVLLSITSAAFVPLNIWLAVAKESPNLYHIHFVNLLIGVTTCVCIPIAIPLFLAWLKPNVKTYFGVHSNS